MTLASESDDRPLLPFAFQRRACVINPSGASSHTPRNHIGVSYRLSRSRRGIIHRQFLNCEGLRHVGRHVQFDLVTNGS